MKGAAVRRSLVAALALTLSVGACSGEGTKAPAPTSRSISSPPTSATGTQTSTASTSTPPESTSPTAASFAYVPLWPFDSVAAAEQWQRDAGAAGQPWHLDAGIVAVSFARQYLGFAEIDHVVSRVVTGGDAHVSVGWTINGKTGTAAVVHLVRIGSGAGRPWEVVGTDDTPTFSLTRPRYGSTVTGSITVGGRITGVDESIRVTARQPSGIVGGYCCLAAGAPAPWSVGLRLTRTQPGPVTIAASTGGHIAAVERFTITGVYSGR